MTWSYSAPSLKWSFCAFVQPPKTSSTVKVLTFGKAFAYLASTLAERGRRWCLAAISWPASLYRYCR
jgi:hypothetical protein